MKLFVVVFCSLFSGVVFSSNNKASHHKKEWNIKYQQDLSAHPNQLPGTATTSDADPSVLLIDTATISSNSKLSLTSEKNSSNPTDSNKKTYSNFSIEAILNSKHSIMKKYSNLSSQTILSSTNSSKTTHPNEEPVPIHNGLTALDIKSVSSLPPKEIRQLPESNFNVPVFFSDVLFSSLSLQSAPKQPETSSALDGTNDAPSSQKLSATNTATKRSVSSSSQSLTLLPSFLNNTLVKTTDDYFGFSRSLGEFSYKSDYRITAMGGRRFYYQTNEFNQFLRFKYTSYICTILLKNREFVANISEELLIKTFEALFSVINSIESHLQPFFYLFRFTNNVRITNYEFLDAPTYFIFTSISYLMKEPEDSEISDTLKALLEIYFHQIVNHVRMAIENWALITSYLGKFFPIPQPKKQSRQQKDPLRFNLSTLAFIHSEMRKDNNSVEAKSFFTESWKACYKNSFKKELLPASIDQDFKISFHDYEKMDLLTSFHKLYQMKFTELIFGNWNRISELLAEYFKLVSEFGRNIDFRRRVFNRVDFEELKSGLKRIEELIKGCSSEDLPKLRYFFIELEYFVNFKSFQFLYDLHNEMKVSLNKIFEYRQTIETIGQIDQIVERIKQDISTKISLSDNTKANSLFPLFPIKELHNFLHILILSINSGNSNEIEFLIKAFNEALKMNTSDFSKTLIHLPGGMSRFQCAEFIAQITEAIKSNSPDEINKIFQSDELKKLKELLSFVPDYLFHTESTEPRKIYLEELSTYLHYFTQ